MLKKLELSLFISWMQGVDKVYEKSASAAKTFEIFPL